LSSSSGYSNGTKEEGKWGHQVAPTCWYMHTELQLVTFSKTHVLNTVCSFSFYLAYTILSLTFAAGLMKTEIVIEKNGKILSVSKLHRSKIHDF
jgi:hypothetical protein